VLQEVVADAADIVSTAPSTLRRQLAEQGLDLEADWCAAAAAAVFLVLRAAFWW
jgi:hypothetical protein